MLGLTLASSPLAAGSDEIGASAVFAIMLAMDAIPERASIPGTVNVLEAEDITITVTYMKLDIAATGAIDITVT